MNGTKAKHLILHVYSKLNYNNKITNNMIIIPFKLILQKTKPK